MTETRSEWMVVERGSDNTFRKLTRRREPDEVSNGTGVFVSRLVQWRPKLRSFRKTRETFIWFYTRPGRTDRRQVKRVGCRVEQGRKRGNEGLEVGVLTKKRSRGQRVKQNCMMSKYTNTLITDGEGDLTHEILLSPTYRGSGVCLGRYNICL